MIIAIGLGILVGILSSGSGLGGGFLVVPFLLQLGKEVKVGHSRAGNVDWKAGALLALGGILGAQLGPLILEHVSDQNFKRIFSILLIGTGLWLFYQSRALP